MTVPFFVDNTPVTGVPIAYKMDTGLTDVDNGSIGVIESVRSLLVTTLGWTEPSTALFKSPPDSAGRFIDILLTRIAALQLQFRVRNGAGVTVATRQCDLTSGLPVLYYASTMGLILEMLTANPNASEWCSGHVLDPAPDLFSDSSNYTIAGGLRNSGNTVDGSGSSFDQQFAIDNGAAAVSARGHNGTSSVNNPIVFQTASGAYMFRDLRISIKPGANFNWAGRVPQMLISDFASFAGQTERTVNLDTTTTGVFKAIGLTDSGQGVYKCFARKS